MGFRQLVRQAIHAAEAAGAFLYAGDRFTCSICEGRFARMRDFRGSYSIRGKLVDHFTPNAICPWCRSENRQRFIWRFLTDRLSIQTATGRLLHLAPERAIYDRLRRLPNLTYTVADIDPAAYPGAVKADITAMPFEDSSFDALLTVHVLEHVANDRAAISEIYRVLAPGGWAVIAVPTYGWVTEEDLTLDAAGRARMYGEAGHFRMNGLDFADKLRAVGLDVDVVSTDDVPGNYMDRSVTTPHTESDRYLFYCRKPVAGH